jgi:hypothetical protein
VGKTSNLSTIAGLHPDGTVPASDVLRSAPVQRMFSDDGTQAALNVALAGGAAAGAASAAPAELLGGEAVGGMLGADGQAALRVALASAGGSAAAPAAGGAQ